MDKLKEIAAYVAAHVEDYEDYLQLALKRMDTRSRSSSCSTE